MDFLKQKWKVYHLIYLLNIFTYEKTFLPNHRDSFTRDYDSVFATSI